MLVVQPNEASRMIEPNYSIFSNNDLKAKINKIKDKWKEKIEPEKDSSSRKCFSYKKIN